MYSMISKQTQKAFSKAAETYEAFSGLQKQIGLRLLDRLPSALPANTRILDIGMGTGWLTEKIAQRFPSSEIIGIDFAQGMLRQARDKKIDFIIQADARSLPFRKKTFDVLVSNCAYQWVDDLSQAFQDNYRVLKKNGCFCFSLFGSKTLHELRSSLKLDDGLPMPSKKQVFSFLEKSGFDLLTMESFCIYEEFEDIFGLLTWLKSIGAHRTRARSFLGKNFLIKANQSYRKNFSSSKGIFATFEVFQGSAKT